MSRIRNSESLTDTDEHGEIGENGYRTIKKRVGGGFKYVKVKTDVQRSDRVPSSSDEETRLQLNLLNDDEVTDEDKQDIEESEKFLKDEIEKENHLKSPTTRSEESINIPFMSEELRKASVNDEDFEYGNYPLLKYIQDNVIGQNVTILGPFGPKRLIYCDYTASGRSLGFIEDYIRTYVCPFYANTHSETGRNSVQTSKFRDEARQIIKKCVNASKDDVVIFTGSGATAGFHKLAWGLKLNHHRVADETVVLTGPYEHHSNLLLWKEFGSMVVRIRERSDGMIDIDHLVSELKFWKDKRRNAIVCMSAASNVTGIITDVDQIASLAHQYGALCVFDYAGGGPYLEINMNTSKQSYKDAVIISPHKFVGGPGTPGIIAAKRWMFKNQVPDRVGGGTVTYVSRVFHTYTYDIEAREEGGTPAIIESIRTGLAFQLKAAVTEKLIMGRDEELCRRAFSVWERNPNLVVLGSHSVERLSIFSCIITHETGKFIHHNFISTLLNDLFGIQSRGGCACAGPYGHDLLGVSESTAKQLKWFTVIPPGKDKNCPPFPMAVMRPGFVRVNLPYFYDDKMVDYIIKAVDLVATHGWKLLPLYSFIIRTGAFVYKGEMSEENEEELFSLHDIDYPGKFHVNRKPPNITSKITLDEMFKDAERILTGDTTEKSKARVSTATKKLNEMIPKEKRKFRWFLTPQDASDILSGSKKIRRQKQFMTIREDDRLYEASDSGLESDRSQASYKQRTSCSPPYHSVIHGKYKQGSESLKEKDENLRCSDCDGSESDSASGYKSKRLHSKSSNESKVNAGQSPRRKKDGHSVQVRDGDSTHKNKSMLNQRSQRHDFHLPKIV